MIGDNLIIGLHYAYLYYLRQVESRRKQDQHFIIITLNRAVGFPWWCIDDRRTFQCIQLSFDSKLAMKISYFIRGWFKDTMAKVIFKMNVYEDDALQML